MLVTHETAGETFAIAFDADTFGDAQRTLGRWASDPELPAFDWWEAAKMSLAIRRKLQRETV